MQVINHRYQLHEKLGEGGMGEVYRATDYLTHTMVALKRVRSAAFSATSHDLQLNLSLAQEFQTLASLRHPNIIEVLDYGFDFQGQPYFTMSLIENARDIRQVAAEQGLIGKVKLLIQILHALDYLHHRHILHRDIKPSNLLIDAANVLRVTDFGLASEDRKNQGRIGTLSYMAPEVLQDQPATPAADLFSVGVIAYEIFTGHYPFSNNNIGHLIKQIIYDDPDIEALYQSIQSAAGIETTYDNPAAPLLPNLPTLAIPDGVAHAHAAALDTIMLEPNLDGLDHIIVRLLAKDPKRRYSSAHEVLHDLYAAINRPYQREDRTIQESFLRSATFVGREAELAQLTQALDDTISHQGSLWLVGGESGVGKSRLLQEVRTYALVTGITVLFSNAESNGGLPYHVWRTPLRQLVLSTDLDDFHAAVLKHLIPDIDDLLNRPITPAPPLEYQADQRRLVETIVHLFRQQKNPMVLFVEDLQWLQESLVPLEHLAYEIEQLPLLIIGSYRRDERPELPYRFDNAKVITLERLDHEGIVTLSAAMLGEAGKQEKIVHFLERETEGNIFFAVETLRALAETVGDIRDIAHATLPDSVFTGGIQQIVRRRLAQVPKGYQPLLKLAAIAGRHLDLALLQQLAPQIPLQSWLYRCADVAVVEIKDGHWRFSHDKLRETLLNDLATAERPMLYRTVGLALEHLYGDDMAHALDLARVWRYADDPAQELKYAQSAGEEALRYSNFVVAAEMFHRALELLPEPTHERLHIKIRLGESLFYLGDYKTAYVRLQLALDLARQINQTHCEAYALFWLSQIAAMRGDFPQTRAYLETALPLAQQSDDRAILARVYYGLGDAAWRLHDFDEARVYVNQSLDIARAIENPTLELFALNRLGAIYFFQDDLETAKQYHLQNLAVAKALGNQERVTAALGNLGEVARLQGDFALAKQYYIASLKIAEETQRHESLMIANCNLGLLALSQADLSEAHRYFYHVLQIALMRQSYTFALYGIMGLAQWVALRGDTQRGLQWLGFVLHHEACDVNVRNDIKPFLAQLQTQVPPAEYEAALQSGHALELDTLSQTILAEFAPV